MTSKTSQGNLVLVRRANRDKLRTRGYDTKRMALEIGVPVNTLQNIFNKPAPHAVAGKLFDQMAEQVLGADAAKTPEQRVVENMDSEVQYIPDSALQFILAQLLTATELARNDSISPEQRKKAIKGVMQSIDTLTGT